MHVAILERLAADKNGNPSKFILVPQSRPVQFSAF
jgi:hypothetical protein